MSIESDLEQLASIRVQHDDYGKKIFELNDNIIFPCHALYLAMLNRSLELLDGFVLLMKEDHYGSGMALLRMQLDNVLRFFGLLITEDPHATANKVIHGHRLGSLKSKSGKKLQDFYLVEEISKQTPWVSHVYKVCSGYVHFSDQHFFQLLGKSELEEDGSRRIAIGPTNEHIDDKHKVELVNGFARVTEAIFLLFEEWKKISDTYELEQLKKRFTRLA